MAFILGELDDWPYFMNCFTTFKLASVPRIP